MSVFDTTSRTTTTLPSWFTTAQESIATQAPTTYGAVTDPSKTVAAGLISDLGSQTANPFTTAISGLQTAQTANANPFLATGAPNTASPLGALFASQNAKLDQILPQLTSQVGAGGIASGNYGSLRGQTAVDTARAGALTTLAADQNKAAMDAMQQSIQAGQALGNVGAQYGTTAMNTANQEMMGGLPALAKYSDIINAMGPTTNKTVDTIGKGSPYENMLKAFNAVGAAGSAFDKLTSGSTGLSWLDNILKNPSYAGSETNYGGNNIDPSAVDPTTGLPAYGGNLSLPGRFEGGEWVND
jgi:hypothetical protein